MRVSSTSNARPRLPRIASLQLETSYMREPGSMNLPASYPADAMLETVPGALGSLVVGPDYQSLRASYVETARRLAHGGADLITANCGFAVSYQDDVAQATGLPTALSSLLLVPLLWRIYPGRLGVLTYDADQLDAARRSDAGWPGDGSVPIVDLVKLPSWVQLRADRKPTLDIPQMREDLTKAVLPFIAQHGLQALLVECTGVIPFSSGIRAETGLAVFDLMDLLRFLADGHVRGRETAANGG